MPFDPQLLAALSNARGIAGQEDAVRTILQEALAPVADRMETDALGNLFVYRHASTHAPANAEEKTTVDPPLKVMIAAHMDEVGAMVVKVNDDGTLKFRAVGGIDPRILPGKRVRIGPDGIPGVVMARPIHLERDNDRERVIPIRDLVIDTGGATGIRPGDMITFEGRFESLGALLKGKAFDDRVGCTVLAALLQRRYPVDVVGVFTVQEEIGLRGARVAAFAVQPDVAIVLEGTIADDLPKDKDVSPVTQVGKGPAISLMDRTALMDRRLVSLLVETARAHAIPYQFKEPGLGGTDAGAIHLAREGVPAVAVSVPCRYIHAPAALLHPRDVDHTVALVEQALIRLGAQNPDAWRPHPLPS